MGPEASRLFDMKLFKVAKFAVCFEPIERLSDTVYGGLVSALCLLEPDEIFALNPFVWHTVFLWVLFQW
jgi:hypothetical protein